MDFVLLEVVPRWSFPAREWVDVNRECGSGSGLRVGMFDDFSVQVDV